MALGCLHDTNSLVSQTEEPEAIFGGVVYLPLPADGFPCHAQIPVSLPAHLHLCTGGRFAVKR